MDHVLIGDDMPRNRAFINDLIRDDPSRGFGLFELYKPTPFGISCYCEGEMYYNRRRFLQQLIEWEEYISYEVRNSVSGCVSVGQN
jgi:hypothetical protein